MRSSGLVGVLVLVFGAACAQESTVRFKTPKDGAVVTSPVRLDMVAHGIRIEPIGGPLHDNAGHFHVMVDRPCFRPDAFVEMHTAGFEHFGDGASTASLDLPPGRHTLCLQVGNGAHVTLRPSHTITITVR